MPSNKSYEYLSSAEIASPSSSVLSHNEIVYILNEAPYTRYISDGVRLNQVSFPTNGLADVVSGKRNNKSILTIGGDHPYPQWYGSDGTDGMAAMYLDKGIQPYLAICYDTGEDNTSGAGATLDKSGMMTAAQARELQAKGVEFISHGARHTHFWELFNTGIRIRYTGTNTQPTVNISSTTITLATVSPSTSIALTRSSYPTINDLVTAIAAQDGTANLNGTWRCYPATELLGTESTENIIPIQAARRNDSGFYSGETKVSGQCFALSGGIMIRYTGTAYRDVTVSVNGSSSFFSIFADGARLIAQTTNTSLTTIVAAVNALNVPGLTCLLMDNGRSQQTVNGSSTLNPGQVFRETYCFGDENGTYLRVHEFTPVTFFGIQVDLGMGFSYAIRRAIECVKERATAEGIDIKGFAQSGGRFYPWFIRTIADEHSFWRGDRSYLEGQSNLSPGNMPINRTSQHTGHFTSRSLSSTIPYTEAEVKAIIDALGDSNGWAVCWLNHLCTPTPSDPSGYTMDVQSDYSDADQDEGPFNRELQYAADARDAGKIEILKPSEYQALRHTRRGPDNLVFNSKFRNGRDGNLLGITSSLTGAAGTAMPGWAITTSSSDYTVASVDSTTRELTLTTNGALAANKTPFGTNLRLERGKTYQIGCELNLREWGTTTSRKFNYFMYPLHTGLGSRFIHGDTSFSSGVFSAGFQGDANFSFSVPVVDTPSPSKAISIAGPFSFTSGHAFTISVDALAVSAPMVMTGLTTAKDIAAYINTQMAADATYGSLTKYHNIARHEDERLILEVTRVGSSSDSTLSQMTLANSTGTPLATLYGAGVTAVRVIARMGERPDSNLVGYRLVFVPSASDATRTLKIRNPYCREVVL